MLGAGDWSLVGCDWTFLGGRCWGLVALAEARCFGRGRPTLHFARPRFFVPLSISPSVPESLATCHLPLATSLTSMEAITISKAADCSGMRGRGLVGIMLRCFSGSRFSSRVSMVSRPCFARVLTGDSDVLAILRSLVRGISLLCFARMSRIFCWGADA